MRSLKIKVLGAAVVAGMTSVMVVAAGPVVPSGSVNKVIEADIAHINKLIELSATKKGTFPRMRVTAALLALYANENVGGSDGAKMGALRDAAIKMAEATSTKDLEKMKAAAKVLAAPTGGTTKPMTTQEIIAATKVDLEELMSIFGRSTAGGMNLEADIRDAKKGSKDAAAAELIGARVAAIAEFTHLLPSSNASGADKRDWDKYTKDMLEFAQQLAAEGAKGSSADAAKLKTVAGKLDASCTNCHNKFRE